MEFQELTKRDCTRCPNFRNMVAGMIECNLKGSSEECPEELLEEFQDDLSGITQNEFQFLMDLLWESL